MSEAQMLYVVGAQKAGTTWLHRYLQDHPDCFVPPSKEAHYWDDRLNAQPLNFLSRRLTKLTADLERARQNGKKINALLRRHADTISAIGMHAGPGHDAYVQFMNRGRADEPVMADITPAYCTLDRASFSEMSELHPDCKFVFIMRDPVERLWSAIRMYYEDFIAETGTDFSTHLDEFEDGIPGRFHSRSDYKRTIQELEAVIPADRLHFAFYETMVLPNGVTPITDFIGIKAIAPNTEKRVHTGEKRNLPGDLEDLFHRKLNGQYRFLHDKFGAEIPAKWRAALPGGR
ncbi:sulfotransferase [Algirhabdus cladophorae]|uniref:sulfotransferase n=1 Tax=Algirhabdus cladophorae TaxID=3377108 RepID=UPI003B849A9D